MFFSDPVSNPAKFTRNFMNLYCFYDCSVTQGSPAPCVKARVSARCAAVPVGLPVTFMFSNVCEHNSDDTKKTQESYSGCLE